ncbi:unnamed protein product, partial [Allacma fusca]
MAIDLVSRREVLT